MKKTFISIFTIFLILNFPVNAKKVPRRLEVRYAQVTTNIRAERSTNSKIVDQLNRGEKVKFGFFKDNWCAVFKDENTFLGYVYAPLLKSSPPLSEFIWQSNFLVVIPNKLNARAGPGTKYGKIGVLGRFNIVNVVGRRNGWSKISFVYNMLNYSYIEGWVSSKYLGAWSDAERSMISEIRKYNPGKRKYPNDVLRMLSRNKEANIQLNRGTQADFKTNESYQYHQNERRNLGYASDKFYPYYKLDFDHWISNNKSGKYIKLEDGSLWKVSPMDRINALLWLPINNIKVIESDNILYPYKLINLDENEVVEVKLLDLE